MKDYTQYCIQCNKPFQISADERDRIIERGFTLPKRCPDCRKNKVKMPGADERWKKKDQKRSDRRKRDYDFDQT